MGEWEGEWEGEGEGEGYVSKHRYVSLLGSDGDAMRFRQSFPVNPLFPGRGLVSNHSHVLVTWPQTMCLYIECVFYPIWLHVCIKDGTPNNWMFKLLYRWLWKCIRQYNLLGCIMYPIHNVHRWMFNLHCTTFEIYIKYILSIY